jgi:23S rRNA U2552 (ribose-2'-O)-methylase RlmE/FtsJ
MNKEKVLEVVNDVITERITSLIEEMSTNEFVEMISDMVYDQTGNSLETEEEQEELMEIIGSRVIPLLHKMSEYMIGKEIPTK